MEPKAKREVKSWTVGEAYMVLTASPCYLGRLVQITPTELVFEDASWIPDTGRLNECLTQGTVVECEPIPDELILPRYGLIGYGWRHALPREVK